ncbi:MAG: VWA domain-containing protein [Acidobacteria bacterium]|nr:VWA domain-containing protein [Acidobacteriota bacterium]
MKHPSFSLRVSPFLVLPLLLFFFPAAGLPEEADNPDQTLSPYFLVKSDDPDVDRLPLKSTSAVVDIAGVIADVVVTQVYENTGKRPLEAVYVFPASTRAAVYGMRMTIGDRVLEAQIKERAQARQDYEDAKAAGQSASLLEQQRPNVFQMNVANILPGDIIQVELRYTELLVPEEGIYEFIYPTVVGPRYSETPAAGAPDTETWVENPYLREGEAATYDFDIRVSLAAGLPIQQAGCTTHKTSIGYDGPALATITLDPAEKNGGNRDFIFRYRLSGGQVESGLLLYEGKEENHFLLMVQPPRRVTPDDIPGREYIFVVDVSGSMRGFPLDVAKTLLRDLIGNLRTSDKFNVILFSGGSRLMSERSLPATTKTITEAISVIDNQQGGGGTRLLPALQRALDLPREEGYARSIVVVTDGYISVEKETFDLIRRNLNRANVFAFGIGSSVNRYLIEGMARAGMGEPLVVTESRDAAARADKFRRYIQSPVLTGIDVNFGRFDVYDVEPPTIPDVLAERPVIVFGKWRGEAAGTVTVTGHSAGQLYRKSFAVKEVRPEKKNLALRYLWARHRIAILGDYNRLDSSDERVKAITDIGLKYNLLTEYTSFVAVDTLVRLVDGKPVTVKQPLPLPQGVSDSAVGGAPQNGRMSIGSVSLPYAAAPTADKMTTAQPVSGAMTSDEESRPRNEGIHAKKEAPEPSDQDGSALTCLRAAAANWRFPAAAPATTVTVYIRFAAGQLQLDRVQLQGGLTETDVRTFFRQHVAAVAACFGPQLQADPAYRPARALRLTIAADGRVTRLEWVSAR